MTTKSIVYNLIFISLIGVEVLSCNHQPKRAVYTKPAKQDKRQHQDQPETTTQFRNEELKDEFKSYKLFAITDTINVDINGDGTIDKVFFITKDNVKRITMIDGLSNKSTIIGNDISFAGMGNDFDWVDFWGVTYDKQTYEEIIKGDEITGEKQVHLNNTSLFVRKDEVGGGVITFRNGKYIWVHQSD